MKIPLPQWLSKYGQFTAEQKNVSKVLWVIRSVVRPNDSHRLTRDIIREMFDSDEDFQKHVLVVFTFNDKSPIDNQAEWLRELCSELPVPQFVSYGKQMTQDSLVAQLLEGQSVPHYELKKDLNIQKLLEVNQ